MNREKIIRALISEALGQVPLGGALQELAAPQLEQFSSRFNEPLIKRLGSACARDIAIFANECPDYAGDGVWDNALMEFEKTLRVFPLEPAFALAHDLEIKAMATALLQLRGRISDSHRVTNLHGFLLEIFIRSYLLEIIKLPEFHLALIQHCLKGLREVKIPGR
jgi:hypothetical protein